MERCETCDSIDAARPDALALIGGSPDPYNEPYGELRRCPACTAWFRAQRDHSNEIGYQADPPSLEKLTRERARALATAALIVARRLHDYFAAVPGYNAQAIAEGVDEIARLEAALVELAP